MSAINNVWEEDYDLARKRYAQEQYERQRNRQVYDFMAALGPPEVTKPAKKPTPEPNPVLLLTGDEE